MLSWARYPDQVFHEVVKAALDLASSGLDQSAPREWLAATMPASAKLFEPPELMALLERLRTAHEDATACYRCTDYHWSLLHEVLEFFAVVHNDGSRPETRRAARIGPYRVGTLRFDDLVSDFFHDTDFLIPELLQAPEALKRQLGISPETWGVVAGLRPHPDEIALVPIAVEGPRRYAPNPGPRVRRLAAYPPAQVSKRTAWYFGPDDGEVTRRSSGARGAREDA